MTERKYLPTLSELVDRLSIVQLKAIFIPESKAAYNEERSLIEHDIDLVLQEKFDANGFTLDAKAVHAIMVIMLANRVIWESESKARAGGDEQDHLLKFTHSVNGVRNTAKNVLSTAADQRIDLKVDAFAEKLIEQFGNWNVFE